MREKDRKRKEKRENEQKKCIGDVMLTIIYIDSREIVGSMKLHRGRNFYTHSTSMRKKEEKDNNFYCVEIKFINSEIRGKMNPEENDILDQMISEH